MRDLNTFGGALARATGVDASGNVVVGWAQNGSGEQRAFRWTESSGLVSLGTLSGGVASSAAAVSADGNVVVGQSDIGGGYYRAFRWTEAGGMQNLGTLGGGWSQAFGVNRDGSVVVGNGSNGMQYNAFRWTTGGPMQDLGTLGGNESVAYSVDYSGDVVVGFARLASGAAHAFRWTSAGMVDLNTLGGTTSVARDVNSDGTVIVGHADIAGNVARRAFRWTESDGMLAVEDWLRNNGVTIASDFTADAAAVSADGRVVVGTTESDTTFIARLVEHASGGGSGIIDVAQYLTTVASLPSINIGISFAGTTLNGVHGEPMRNLLDAGRQSFSVTTDVGYDDGATSRGGLGLGDFSYAIGLEGGVTARLASGGLYTRQDIDTGGDFNQKGVYIAPEASLPIANGFYATVGGYYAFSGLAINRGYLNAGLPDYSRGQADTRTWAAKLRLDWLNAASGHNWNLTPYTSLAYIRSHVEAYSEHGGSFPSAFDSVSDHSTVARAGLDIVADVTDSFRLTGKAEAAYRFENRTAERSGRIIGLSGFRLAGQDVDQFWLRGAVGAEVDTNVGTAFVSINATTNGDDPNLWLKSGWKVNF